MPRLIPTSGSPRAWTLKQHVARRLARSRCAWRAPCAVRAWSFRCGTGSLASMASGAVWSRPSVPRCAVSSSPPCAMGSAPCLFWIASRTDLKQRVIPDEGGGRPLRPLPCRYRGMPMGTWGPLAPRSDEKGITVSAVPARRPRIKRVVRTLGLDRNPLRRATDRAMAWIRVGIVAAFLAAAPLAAIAAGHWMYHAATTEARTQAAVRHSVQAVLLQPTPPPVLTMAATHWGGQAWVLARRQSPVTAPPLQPAQITDRTVAVAAAAPAVLALSLLIAALIGRDAARSAACPPSCPA